MLVSQSPAQRLGAGLQAWSQAEVGRSRITPARFWGGYLSPRGRFRDDGFFCDVVFEETVSFVQNDFGTRPPVETR